MFLIIALMPAAQAEIYKCTDEYGNVAYLQTPCPIEVAKEPEVADEEEDVEDVTEFLPEPQPVETNIPSSRQPDEPLEACKKRYRDQIDKIDAELGVSLSPSQASAYKERLLELTTRL